MLTFLQPILLWASAAVAVPLIIHLWNTRQGKTLKVGSISLLKESTKKSAHNLRISQWLLLTLRCLLIVCLAFLLAKAVSQTSLSANDKGWILIEKSVFAVAYKKHPILIDSLVHKGYSLHYLDASFGIADKKDTAIQIRDAQEAEWVSTWSLLEAVQEKLPAGFPLVVLAGNRLRNVGSSRPQLSLPVTWVVVPSQDTAARWIAEAFQTPSDSIKTIITHSKPHGNDNEYINVHPTEPGHEFTILQDQEGWYVVAKDSGLARKKIDTATLHCIVYAGENYLQDANYLQASLNAIGGFSQRKLNVNIVRSSHDVAMPCNWLFWLSDEPLPAKFRGCNSVQYEKGHLQKEASFLLPNSQQALYADAGIALYQYYTDSLDSNKTVWQNGFNQPMLTLEQDSVLHYHFYSRFHPQWSDLVWQASFPQLLLQLIFDQSKEEKTGDRDLRSIAANQLQPVFQSPVNKRNTASAQVENDRSHLFWIMAFILFAGERLLSFILNKRRYA